MTDTQPSFYAWLRSLWPADDPIERDRLARRRASGLVVDSGTRRSTSSGRNAIVWVAA